MSEQVNSVLQAMTNQKYAIRHLSFFVIAPVDLGSIKGMQFFGGIQTNITGWSSKESRRHAFLGKGAIISRWSSDKKTPIGMLLASRGQSREFIFDRHLRDQGVHVGRQMSVAGVAGWQGNLVFWGVSNFQLKKLEYRVDLQE